MGFRLASDFSTTFKADTEAEKPVTQAHCRLQRLWHQLAPLKSWPINTQQKDDNKYKGWSQMAYQSTMSPLPHPQGFYSFRSYSKTYLKRLF